MRKVIGASMLVLVLSCSAYAGYIPNDRSTPEPQPTPTTSTTTQEAAGSYIPNGQTAESTATTVTEVVLSLLQSVLPLF